MNPRFSKQSKDSLSLSKLNPWLRISLFLEKKVLKLKICKVYL